MMHVCPKIHICYYTQSALNIRPEPGGRTRIMYCRWSKLSPASNISLAGASIYCVSYQSISVPLSQNKCKHASSHKWNANEYAHVHNTINSRQITFIIK